MKIEKEEVKFITQVSNLNKFIPESFSLFRHAFLFYSIFCDTYQKQYPNVSFCFIYSSIFFIFLLSCIDSSHVGTYSCVFYLWSLIYPNALSISHACVEGVRKCTSEQNGRRGRSSLVYFPFNIRRSQKKNRWNE